MCTSSSGVQANGGSRHGRISDDGRFIAFSSYANNLVPSDTNLHLDVFVKDMVTGDLERVSLGAGGTEANLECAWPEISGDGGVVTFISPANNLVPGQNGPYFDIFAVEVQTGAIELVSRNSRGNQGLNSAAAGAPISADGNLILFRSFAPNLDPSDGNFTTDIFLRDRAAGTTTRLSFGVGGEEFDRASYAVGLTPDARLMTFSTSSGNVSAAGGTGQLQVYVGEVRPGAQVGQPFCQSVPNSTGRPATLWGNGTPVASKNAFRLVVTDLPLFSFGYFLCSQTQGFTPGPNMSDGNLCLDGQVGRFNALPQIGNAGTAGAFGLDVDLNSIPTPTGPATALAGDTWNFQAWHRDTGAGGGLTSNFSQGLSVRFW